MIGKAVTRRRFLEVAATALGAPYVIPSSALGADGHAAPSERVTVGCIGVGGRGRSNMMTFLHTSQVVAVCDVDAGRREAARRMVDGHYMRPAAKGTGKGCTAHHDFRELVARDDVDAVSVCTPDHWHAIPAVAAAKSGKDVFCEKPLSLTVAEGRAICEAVTRYGRVFQHGTQRRSSPRFAHACELVRNGRIGRLHTIRVSSEPSHACPNEPPAPVPRGFDYDLWLGPAPRAPYGPRRVRTPWWYWIADYTIGFVAGQGVHFTDVAQWGGDFDATGPVAIEGRGLIPDDGLCDTATQWHVELTFAGGVRMVYTDHRAFPMGVIFEGTEGTVRALCGGISTTPKSLLSSRIAANETRLLRSRRGHVPGFIDCVKTRGQTAAPAEAAHRASSLCHLTHIAILTGRKLKWDPVGERFTNDPEANLHLSRPMRAPWHL